jgi:hypothetical protein
LPSRYAFAVQKQLLVVELHQQSSLHLPLRIRLMQSAVLSHLQKTPQIHDNGSAWSGGTTPPSTLRQCRAHL